MKRTLLILSICLCAAVSLAQETKEPIANSKISSVIVYSDRALVKRSFSSDLPGGFTSLRIPNLPSTLINESVRVTGKGTSVATISGVRVEEKFLEDSAQEDVKNLQDQIDVLIEQINTLEDRKFVLADKKTFIQSIGSSTTESITKNIAVQRPSMEEWTGMVSFMDKTLTEIATESRHIELEIKDLNNKKSVLDQEMRLYKYSGGKSKKSVVVDLEMENPGAITMELSYIVIGANWTPIYDIRASSENDSISIVFMANVSQNTGEDWKDVKLELSTAKPFVGDAPRGLSPWYLDIKSPTLSFRTGRAGAEEVSYMVDGIKIEDTLGMSAGSALGSSQMKQLAETQLAVADVSQQIISTSFILKQTETIPSDNKAKKVSVKVATAVGEKDYYAIPKLSNYVYLRSKITNKTSFPLLAGSASVFFDGAFVSTTRIPLVVPTEDFELYLGIDENFRLKRELAERFVDKTGIMSRKNNISYSYRITVENLRKTEHSITVLDQIPVSQNDDIDVKLQEISPEPQYKEKDEELGILRWALKLKPGEKKELSFDYEIKYPAGIVLSGIN